MKIRGSGIYMDANGKSHINSVNAKNFSVSGKVEVNSLTVEQTLKISGKPQIDFVTAKEIIIATRSGFLVEVKCHKIRIFDDTDKVFGKGLAELSSRSCIQINNIEADTVELENCTVEVTRCKDAFIGSNCSIDKLFVAGECKVADDSTVVETIHIKKVSAEI
ncbi:MAG: hypothetical protein IJG32_00780 [Selenomonadaceae bacterium]|nr:hypothetical protein [Selenomonadaceae bacterium]